LQDYLFTHLGGGKGNVGGEGKPAERERFLPADSWRVLKHMGRRYNFLLGFQKKQYPLFILYFFS
jgi:hypothetical protein